MKKQPGPGRKRVFQSMQQIDVPQSRNGKHRKIVTTIVDDVKSLASGAALKVPLAALQDSKENGRSALSRECKKRKIVIATAVDDKYLYVWSTGPALAAAASTKTSPRSLANQDD